MPLFENLEEFQNVSPALQWAIFVTACLIALVAVVAIAVSIWLSVRYVVYNRKMNARRLTGEEAARKILDQNGLQDIKVSVIGSMMFGNSYSHYFKKVRLRRLTVKKPSVSSLAMGAEKAALAVLDRENDPDMRMRVALTPLMYLGPFAFIPLIAIGLAIDIFLLNFSGVATMVAAGLGLCVYAVSFVLSVMTLRTEKKAQARACEILRQEDMATDEEIGMMKELFKLYNIQYVNDIIMEMLQLILKVLQFIAKIQQSSASKND